MGSFAETYAAAPAGASSAGTVALAQSGSKILATKDVHEEPWAGSSKEECHRRCSHFLMLSHAVHTWVCITTQSVARQLLQHSAMLLKLRSLYVQLLHSGS